ncbi:DUF4230 domain-containing protein [Sphingomonas flavalba]|uniref:DUF4230 domain-containing protein n=1 Tax=Sphingomonas flavalba TaxID=2559804 RepID=UPI0039E05BAB
MGSLGRLVAGVLLLAVLVGGAFLLAVRYVEHRVAPEPETIVSGSLQGLREQNRLSAFAARYVAVVTSKQQRFGVLSAERTLIMPGTVRYEVNLARLTQQDVRWDAATRTLSITLPPVELVGPQVDVNQVKAYDNGGLLLSLTDARQILDDANRKAGQTELLRQARDAVPMRLARDATRRAVERSFALPLRAAGVDATVVARFADDDRAPSRLDRSRSVKEVLGDAATAR